MGRLNGMVTINYWLGNHSEVRLICYKNSLFAVITRLTSQISIHKYMHWIKHTHCKTPFNHIFEKVKTNKHFRSGDNIIFTRIQCPNLWSAIHWSNCISLYLNTIGPMVSIKQVQRILDSPSKKHGLFFGNDRMQPPKRLRQTVAPITHSTFT